MVGKPNTGKSTFFSAATLVQVAIANYPFTTIKPNHGISYVRTRCVHPGLGVIDTPRNSKCVEGERFIPVDLVDTAGLVPGAWEGRGLGNRFLDEVRKADALIHVIDASGATDLDGKPVKMGSHDPVEDVKFLEQELDMWMLQILQKDWEKIAKKAEVAGEDPAKIVSEKLSGLGIHEFQTELALKESELGERLTAWSKDDLLRLVDALRRLAKPMLLVANKMDLPYAQDNLDRLRETGYSTIAACSEAELALRRATEKGLITYHPGDNDFTVNPSAALSTEQKTALEMVRERVLKDLGTTGVQDTINSAFFKLLDMLVVYPVEDPERYTDHDGRVLPDAYLVPRGTTLKQMANMIHTELGAQML
ncbi:MAG TPA: redox-regulated ATPase YchF, partial [Candidatus Binatus sp.]|nr:redox-regulated ATPase YchF [Candidatus Binatus sp.]